MGNKTITLTAAEARKIKEALEFYADKNAYGFPIINSMHGYPPSYGNAPVLVDEGGRAKEALALLDRAGGGAG